MKFGNDSKRKNVREELLKQGYIEISQNGIQNISLRKIAADCGVSCAAPYKHFNDKMEFIVEVVKYTDEIWNERIDDIISLYPGDVRRQLIEVSMEYIDFMVTNPYYRSAIMTKKSNNNPYGSSNRNLNPKIIKIIEEYNREYGRNDKINKIKVFVVRSIIFGSALLFDEEQYEYNAENKRLVRYIIEREFSLNI